MRNAMLSLLAVAVCASAGWAQVPDTFLKKWPEAQKAAQQANKPLYIHFTTTWCGWCRKIEKETYTNEAAKKALADFICVSLDCTVPEGQEPSADAKVNQALMDRLGGTGYPFLVMATADGVVLNTIGGYVPPEGLVKELDVAKGNFKECLQFTEYQAKADKKSYEYNLKAMQFYSKMHNGEKALAAAQEVLTLDPKNAKGDALQAKMVVMEISNDPPDKTASLAEEIQKLDPQNEKGSYEKAMGIQAMRELGAARQDKATAPAHMEAVGKIVETMTTKGLKLAEPQRFMYLGGLAEAGLGHFDKALALAEKGLALCKDPQETKAFGAMVERLKAMKEATATAGATSGPATSMPASMPAGGATTKKAAPS